MNIDSRLKIMNWLTENLQRQIKSSYIPWEFLNVILLAQIKLKHLPKNRQKINIKNNAWGKSAIRITLHKYNMKIDKQEHSNFVKQPYSNDALKIYITVLKKRGRRYMT